MLAPGVVFAVLGIALVVLAVRLHWRYGESGDPLVVAATIAGCVCLSISIGLLVPLAAP
jgi:hypothetical protein